MKKTRQRTEGSCQTIELSRDNVALLPRRQSPVLLIAVHLAHIQTSCHEASIVGAPKGMCYAFPPCCKYDRQPMPKCPRFDCHLDESRRLQSTAARHGQAASDHEYTASFVDDACDGVWAASLRTGQGREPLTQDAHESRLGCLSECLV